MKQETKDLIVEGTIILQRYGPDSQELRDFIRLHENDERFRSLMHTAIWLSNGLKNPKVNSTYSKSFVALMLILGCIVYLVICFIGLI